MTSDIAVAMTLIGVVLAVAVGLVILGVDHLTKITQGIVATEIFNHIRDNDWRALKKQIEAEHKKFRHDAWDEMEKLYRLRNALWGELDEASKIKAQRAQAEGSQANQAAGPASESAA